MADQWFSLAGDVQRTYCFNYGHDFLVLRVISGIPTSRFCLESLVGRQHLEPASPTEARSILLESLYIAFENSKLPVVVQYKPPIAAAART